MKHHWMTTSAKFDFDKTRETTRFLSRKAIRAQDKHIKFTANIAPYRILSSRRAKNYRQAILSNKGNTVPHILSDMLPPAVKSIGYITLGEFIDNPGIGALTSRNGQNLALLVAPIDKDKLSKITKLKYTQKLATQAKSIHEARRIRQQINTTIRVGGNAAVNSCLKIFYNNPELNPKAFLYPIYINDGESPQNTAQIIHSAIYQYNKISLIPVFTSINTASQTAIDLYMAAMLNHKLDKALSEFNKLTQARYGSRGRTENRLLALLKGVKSLNADKTVFSLLSKTSQKAIDTRQFDRIADSDLKLLPHSVKSELELILEIRKVKQARTLAGHLYQKQQTAITPLTQSSSTPEIQKSDLLIKAIHSLTNNIAKLSKNESILRKQNAMLRQALAKYVADIKTRELSIGEKEVHIIRKKTKINKLILQRQKGIGILIHKGNDLKKKRKALTLRPEYMLGKQKMLR